MPDYDEEDPIVVIDGGIDRRVDNFDEQYARLDASIYGIDGWLTDTVKKAKDKGKKAVKVAVAKAQEAPAVKVAKAVASGDAKKVVKAVASVPTDMVKQLPGGSKVVEKAKTAVFDKIPDKVVSDLKKTANAVVDKAKDGSVSITVPKAMKDAANKVIKDAKKAGQVIAVKPIKLDAKLKSVAERVTQKVKSSGDHELKAREPDEGETTPSETVTMEPQDSIPTETETAMGDPKMKRYPHYQDQYQAFEPPIVAEMIRKEMDTRGITSAQRTALYEMMKQDLFPSLTDEEKLIAKLSFEGGTNWLAIGGVGLVALAAAGVVAYLVLRKK